MKKTFAEQLRDWADSPAGKKALEESVEKVAKVEEKLKKARELTWEDLNKPFTR